MKKSRKMDPAEVEFLAEREMVTIVPNFKEKKMFLLSGDFGPFSPGDPVEVPIWMAVSLKQKQKCRLHAPEWMGVEKLLEFKERETDEDVFTKPPSNHYMEISSMLLKCASDDIQNADEVRTLIKDIWDVRLAKLRRSIDQMVMRQETHAQIDNLTVMEINRVRTILGSALDQMHNLRCYVAQLPTPTT